LGYQIQRGYIYSIGRKIGRPCNLRDNNAIINEFTSGAPYGMRYILNKQQNRDSKFRGEIFTE